MHSSGKKGMLKLNAINFFATMQVVRQGQYYPETQIFCQLWPEVFLISASNPILALSCLYFGHQSRVEGFQMTRSQDPRMRFWVGRSFGTDAGNL